MMLPETYVSDLQVRLGLYRRLATLKAREDIDSFADELLDRFGPLPGEVEHLLDVVEIKALCLRAGIAQIDAGPKGASIVFRKGQFANAKGLVAFIQASRGLLRLMPDQKLVFKAEWDRPVERLKGVRVLAQELARVAEAG